VAFIAKLGIKGPRFSGIVDRTIQEMNPLTNGESWRRPWPRRAGWMRPGE
jgi:hypothetical protein